MTNEPLSTIKQDSIIAVPEGAEAGAICWWRLHGEVSADALASAWVDDAGFDEDLLPPANTPGSALGRAMRRQQKGRTLVRPLDEECSYAVVIERADGRTLRHEQVLTVSVAEGGGLAFDGDIDGAGLRDMTAAIDRDYRHVLATLDHNDVSFWISSRLLPHVNAVSLRPSGGIYFVPAGGAVHTWRRMVTAIRSVSQHQVYEVAAMHTASAVEAILAAVSREAEEQATQMETELIDMDLGARALRNRVAKLDRVATKVAAYEGLLGSGLDTLRARLEALNVQMAAAIFTAEAKTDAEQEAA